MTRPVALARRIRLLLMDVDGVLTDGRLFYVGTGPGKVAETKAFDSHDGVGLFLLREGGIRMGVISGRDSAGVAARARILGIEFVRQGIQRKLPAYEAILSKAGLRDEQVAFIGDDLPDLPVLRRAGLAIAPADAVPEVRRAARYVTRRPGGRGAVREVAELLLKAQGRWRTILRQKGYVP